MKAIVDTNVLLRLLVGDDPDQSKVASETLEAAESMVIGLQALCELVWVLDRTYETPRADISTAIRQILDTGNVIVNRTAVEAGLSVLEAGGDFADGIIAFEGRWLGGDTFVTFDKKAAKILGRQEQKTKLLTV